MRGDVAGRLLASWLLPLAAITGCATAPKAEPESVVLAFAWDPGLTATVTATRTRTRVTGRRSTRSATWRYTLRVAPKGDGLHIHFEDPSFALGGDADALPAPDRARIIGQLADPLPDLLVTRAGELVGIHDLHAYQTSLRRFLGGIVPAELDADELDRIQAPLTSEAFLSSRAAEQWNAIVGAWAGAELLIGELYGYSGRESLALFPGEEVRMNYTFSAKRVLPCRRGGVERSCAELELTSIADPEDTKRMLRSFRSRRANGSPPRTPAFRSLELSTIVSVLTEPEGLVPHELTLTRTVRGVVAADDAEQSMQQVDVTRVSYAYP